MITLRLSSFTVDEVHDLINRLNVINPEKSIRCAIKTCDKCEVKHVCYAITKAIEYAEAYLDGRSEAK